MKHQVKFQGPHINVISTILFWKIFPITSASWTLWNLMFFLIVFFFSAKWKKHFKKMILWNNFFLLRIAFFKYHERPKFWANILTGFHFLEMQHYNVFNRTFSNWEMKRKIWANKTKTLLEFFSNIFSLSHRVMMSILLLQNWIRSEF